MIRASMAAGLSSGLALLFRAAIAGASPDAGCVPTPEVCDGLDNDCDGLVDNEPDGGPPLCEKTQPYWPSPVCVHTAYGNECAYPCHTICQGEWACCPGQACVSAADAGDYCMDVCSNVGYEGAEIVCGPPETPVPDCRVLPYCMRRGADCVTPCSGVTCSEGLTCARFGPSAGACVPDDCDHIPCTGCGDVCVDGVCVSDPCQAVVCPPGEVCAADAGPACVPTSPGSDAGTGGAQGGAGGAHGGAGGAHGGAAHAGGPEVFGGCGCTEDRSGGERSTAMMVALALIALSAVRMRSSTRDQVIP